MQSVPLKFHFHNCVLACKTATLLFPFFPSWGFCVLLSHLSQKSRGTWITCKAAPLHSGQYSCWINSKPKWNQVIMCSLPTVMHPLTGLEHITRVDFDRTAFSLLYTGSKIKCFFFVGAHLLKLPMMGNVHWYCNVKAENYSLQKALKEMRKDCVH